MAKLLEYASFKEKDTFFKNEIIDTKAAIDKIFDELVNNEESKIFRGCNEARYKQYTSAQRYWLQYELEKQGLEFYDFITSLIGYSKSWNSATLKTFFEAIKILSNDDLAFLSYMQHNKLPTPLLDFTYDVRIGFYFAFHQCNVPFSDNTIDNYCSLYILNPSNEYYITGSKQLNNISKEGKVSYEDLASFPLLLIPTKDVEYQAINSVKISNQKGLFMFNNDEEKPIEEVYLKEIDEQRKRLDVNYDDKFATCINFHKSLKSYVFSKLKQEGVSESYVYPNDESLKKFALEQTLSNL